MCRSAVKDYCILRMYFDFSFIFRKHYKFRVHSDLCLIRLWFFLLLLTRWGKSSHSCKAPVYQDNSQSFIPIQSYALFSQGLVLQSPDHESRAMKSWCQVLIKTLKLHFEPCHSLEHSVLWKKKKAALAIGVSLLLTLGGFQPLKREHLAWYGMLRFHVFVYFWAA